MFGKSKKNSALSEQDKASRTVNRLLTLAFMAFIVYSVLGKDNTNPQKELVPNAYEIEYTNTVSGKVEKIPFHPNSELVLTLSSEDLDKISTMPKPKANEASGNFIAFKIKLTQKAVEEVKPANNSSNIAPVTP